MKEYSLGLGACRRGRRESGRRTTGGLRMELRRRSGVKLHFGPTSSHHLVINISDFWTLQHYHFPRESKFPLLPLPAGAHEGLSLLVIFTKRHQVSQNVRSAFKKTVF